MIIADTDVLIDYLAGAGPAADRIAIELTSPHLRTTVISRFELLAGARSDRQRHAVDTLLESIPALPLDADAADRAAGVRRQLSERGLQIGMADSLIAGIVLHHGGILLTRNFKHFERVDGLRLSGRYGGE